MGGDDSSGYEQNADEFYSNRFDPISSDRATSEGEMVNFVGGDGERSGEG